MGDRGGFIMFKVETITYTGQDQFNGYPSEGSWKGSFLKSEIGETYQVLTDDDNNYIMCLTEMEDYALKALYDLIDERGGNLDILVLGWGVGHVNSELEARGCSVWYMEKYPEIVDLSPAKNKEDIIIADANTCSFIMKFPLKRFDIIFNHMNVGFENRESAKNILRDEGEIVDWRFRIPAGENVSS